MRGTRKGWELPGVFPAEKNGSRERGSMQGLIRIKVTSAWAMCPGLSKVVTWVLTRLFGLVT